MAPLVAGIMVGTISTPVIAGYAYIENLVWPESPDDACATVYVKTTSIPPPYSPPRAAFAGDPPTTPNNYFWWFSGDRTYAQYSDGYTTASIYHPETNQWVSVYVYSTTDNLSWATLDRTYGYSVYMGP
jgi:hypothetical protein